MSEDTLGTLLQKANEEEAKQSALRSSLTYGMMQNPDERVKAQRVGAALGITPAGAQQNLSNFERSAAANAVDYDALIRNSPKSAQWLSDPENAAVAHDDLSILQRIEQAAVHLADVNFQLAQVPQKAMGGLFRAIGGGMRWAGELGQSNALARSLLFSGSQESAQAAQQIGQDVRNYYAPLFNAPGLQPLGAPGKAAGFVGGIAGTMGKATLSGPMAPLVFGAEAAGEAAGSALEGGATPGQATARAAGSGTLNAALAFIPGMKFGGETALGQAIAAGGVGGIAKELGKGLAVRAARGTVLGTGVTWGENALARMTGEPTRPMNEGLPENIASFIGLEYAGYLGHAVKATAESKLKARSPEGFQSAMQVILDGSGAEKVLVPADRLEMHFQDKGPDPLQVASEIEAKLGAEVARRFLEAKAAGTDVEIPTADFLAKLDTEQHQALLPDLKGNPDQMSMREHDAWVQSGGPEQVRKALEGISQEVQGQPEYQAVREELRKRYIAGGERPEIADDHAAKEANVFINMARESGMKPMELLNFYDPKVVVGEVPTTLDTGGKDAGLPRDAAASPVPGSESRGIAGGLSQGEVQGGPRLPGEGIRPSDRVWHGTPDNGFEQLRAEDLARQQQGGMGPGLHVSAGPDQAFAHTEIPTAEGTGSGEFNPTGLWKGQISRDYRPFDAAQDTTHTVETLGKIGILADRPMTGEEVWQRLVSKLGEEKAVQFLKDKGFHGLYYNYGGEDAWSIWQDQHVQRSARTSLEQARAEYQDQGSRRDPVTGMLLGDPGAEDFHFQPGKKHTAEDYKQIRARLAMSRSLSPSGQSAELTRRAIDAMTDAEAFRAFEREVLGVQNQSDITGSASSRGWFRVLPDGTFEIGKSAKFGDLSSLIHEAGHSHLYMMRDLAKSKGASDVLKSDWQKTLDFLGAPDGAKITEAQHEKYARAEEVYLREGKAPTADLRGVFHRFAIWLGSVYRKAASLGVELSPEIRGVFDRLYAGDRAIEQAQRAVDMKPLFATPEQMGLTPAEFSLYAGQAGKAIASAREAIGERLLKDFQREQESWWQEAAAKVRDVVRSEVDAEPVYQAFRALHEGKMADGTPIKLNKEAMVARYGEDAVKALPRSFQRTYGLEGGMDAESAAELLGFPSGDHLVQALQGMEPRKARIERLTDERMKAEHGDLLTDGTLPDASVEALHNDAREQMLRAELRALRAKEVESRPAREFQRKIDEAKTEEQRKAAQDAWEAYQKDRKAKAGENRRQAREASQIAPQEEFRRAAAELVDSTTVRDLDPYRYLLASRREGKKAFAAMAKDDYAAAAEAKQKELLNHHLYLEATKARAEARDIADYGKEGQSLRFQGMLGKAGEEIQGQWNALAKRYEFRTVPYGELDTRKQSLEAWAREQEAAGEGIIIDPAMLQEATPKNWREVPISELRALRDGLKNIETIARRQLRVLRGDQAVEMAQAVNELVDGARGNLKVKPLPLDENTRTAAERAVKAMKALNTGIAKVERVIDHLDKGDINGPWRRYIFEPMALAQFKEHELNTKVTALLSEAMETMPKAQRHALLERHNIEGIGVLSRKAILTLALNMGNASNRDKMVRGMGWADQPEKVWKALDVLNRADWEFVQKTWNAIDTLWPEISALQRRMTGVAPPRVEREAFTVKLQDGTEIKMDGGYFPMVYDRTRSTAGERQADADILGTEGGFNGPVTFKGHTKERIQGFAAPIELDFERVLVQHVSKVIKDLSHREAALSVSKLIRNQDVRLALSETMGQPYTDMLMPWLKGTVNNVGGAYGPGTGALGQLMMSARSNLVLSALAFRAGSVLVQVTDFGRALTEVKPRYLGDAVLKFGAHPIETTKMVRELSQEMLARTENLDRDTRDMLKRQQGKDGLMAATQRAGMQGLAWADTVTSVTTWLGAYNQATDELTAKGMDPAAVQERAVRMADRAMRLTMMSNAPKDQVEVQRAGNLAMKFFTMFMGDATATYGIMNKGVRDVAMGQDVAASLFKMAMVGVMLPVVGQIIKNRGPRDDEDKVWWSTKAALLSLPSSIPILRDIAQALETGNDYQFTPLAGAINKSVKSARITKAWMEGKKEWGDAFLHGADAFGSLSGVPGTSQAMTTTRYLHDLKTGKQPTPNSEFEFWKNAIFGPNPKGRN